MNVISWLFGLLTWGVVAFLAIRIYKKQTVKPKIWKLAIVLYVGLFCFSLNWPVLDTIVKTAILPLGVWILYFFMRNKESWNVYRSYAWLGFWANYLFVATTLLSIPVYSALYPTDEPQTYFGNIEKAEIIQTHPSANGRTLDHEAFLDQLQTMKQGNIASDQWYRDAHLYTSDNQVNERFPYLLIGTRAKWGSGLNTLVFIEEDGKGILVTTPKDQLYFRSEVSLLEGGE